MQNEEALIRRAAEGDERAFEEILRTYEKQVYNLCLRMTNNADDAYDLSQESFIKVWRSLGDYQFQSSFSTWLYRLVRNTCIDHLRRQKRQKTVSLTVQSDEEEPEELLIPDLSPLPQDVVEEHERQTVIADAIARLPDDYREILQLRAGQELGYEEIAEILGIKVGTVKSRLARAREQLRKNLKDGNFFDLDSSETVRKGADAP